VLVIAASQTTQRVYKSIYCHAICDSNLTGELAGNLSTRRSAPRRTLLCKRFLLIIELVFAHSCLVGKLVGFPLHPFLVVGDRVDALIRPRWLRTFRKIRIRFISHGFTLQPTSMRAALWVDARSSPTLRNPFRRKMLPSIDSS